MKRKYKKINNLILDITNDEGRYLSITEDVWKYISNQYWIGQKKETKEEIS